MMIQIEEVAKGQKFTLLGVEYKMLRIQEGLHKQPKRNQWGRAIGGHYDAMTVCVMVNRYHRGWRFTKVAIRPGQRVIV